MGKVKNEITSPKRIDSHKIDSLAMRFVGAKFPSYWIDRDLSERDYGIDLAIEIFNQKNNSVESETSTGLLSLIQVKGTTIPLEKRDGYYKFSNFPVRTLNYAMQFKIPFILIVVSVNRDSLLNSTAHFLWLQDYIRKDGYGCLRKDWRLHKKITLRIPIENDFVQKQSFFEDCVKEDHFEMEKIDAVKKYYQIKCYTESISNVGNYELVMDMWLDLLASIDKLDFMKKEYDIDDDFDIAFDIEKIKKICLAIKKQKTIAEQQKVLLQKALKKIEYIIYDNFDE